METLVVPACAEIQMATSLPDLRDRVVRAVHTMMPCDFRKTRAQRRAAAMQPPDRVSIFLAEDRGDPATGEVVQELAPLLGAAGANPPAGYPSGESKWIAKHVRDSQAPLFIPDTRQDADNDNKPAHLGPNWHRLSEREALSTAYGTHCAIAAPITAGNGRFLGVVQVLNTLNESWDHFHSGLREPDLSNLIKLIPCIATKIAQLRGPPPNMPI
jgi:hypothetical protein